MTLSKKTAFWGLCTAPGLLFAAGCCQDKAAVQPDIVFILADDLGYGDVHCFNPDRGLIPTPNIDRLASEGIMFTDAHASSSLSTPSRYSVMTGRYPWRTIYKQGVQDGFSEAMIVDGRPTLGTMLKDLGYGTACIGKWHLGWHWQPGTNNRVDLSQPISEGPLDRGFDYFFGLAASLDMAPYVFVENNNATETEVVTMPKDKGVHLIHGGMAGANFKCEECLPELTRHAVAHVRSWKGSKQPHFLYMPLTAPHTPCFPSPEFKGRTGLGDYADFVVMMDDAVGQVINAVKKAGRYDRTVFVFASDNGCAPYAGVPQLEKAGHFPSGVFRGYKSDVWEGGHRIPFVIAGKPAVDAAMRGTKVDEFISLADMFATFRELAGGGTEPLADMAEDSFSILPLVKGGDDLRQTVISVSGSGWFSIRERRYKLIFTHGSGGWSSPSPSRPAEWQGLPERQLYDLSTDPGETTNLIDVPELQPIVKDLTEQLRAFIIAGRSSEGPAAHNDTGPHWRQNEPVFKEY